MVSVCRPVYVSRQTLSFKTSQGYVPDAYRAHDFELFASSCLGHPNRLAFIQLSVTGMPSVGWLGDGDLPI